MTLAVRQGMAFGVKVFLVLSFAPPCRPVSFTHSYSERRSKYFISAIDLPYSEQLRVRHFFQNYII